MAAGVTGAGVLGREEGRLDARIIQAGNNLDRPFVSGQKPAPQSAAKRSSAAQGRIAPGGRNAEPARRFGALRELDPGAMSADGSQPRVTRQQRRVEPLGERQIRGVAGRQVVPKLPDPFQQRLMGMSLDGHRGKVRERVPAVAFVDVSVGGAASQGVGDLDIQQVRSVQRVIAFDEALFQLGARIGAEQYLDHDGRVDDDHRLSRPSRTMSAAGTLRLTRGRGVRPGQAYPPS